MALLTRGIAYGGITLFIGAIMASSAAAQVNVTNEVVAADTVLVWEAKTYTPPFYKGKALLPDGGDARILAFPPTHLGNPYELSYKWKVNGTVIPEASGYGRSFYVYESDIFGGSPLFVVEVSKDGTEVSTGVLRIPLVESRVLLYPALPLAGVLFGNQARTAEGPEVTLEAYPLFMSVAGKSDPALTYEWELDGLLTRNPLGNSGRLIVRSNEAGESLLSLTAYNQQNILETAEASLTLTFDE